MQFKFNSAFCSQKTHFIPMGLLKCSKIPDFFVYKCILPPISDCLNNKKKHFPSIQCCCYCLSFCSKMVKNDQKWSNLNVLEIFLTKCMPISSSTPSISILHFSRVNYSSDILNKTKILRKSSTENLTWLSNVKFQVKDFFELCGLLRKSEL